jgi:hypothetical protein
VANLRFPNLLFFLLACTITVVSGCGTLPNGRGWGQDATLLPGWRKIGHAALNAALSPATLAPAAGALVFQIDGWDEKVSNWGSRRTPIFGSQAGAHTASDVLESLSTSAYGLTAVATPSGDAPGEWTLAKLKGFTVGGSAIAITYFTSEALQRSTDRQRPNDSGKTSFPSTHSARASVSNILAARNLDFISMPASARLAGKVGLAMLTLSTAWARVEAKEHYPSDVLAGMALGNFIGAFINDAFIGADPKDFAMTLEPSQKGAVLAMYWAF